MSFRLKSAVLIFLCGVVLAGCSDDDSTFSPDIQSALPEASTEEELVSPPHLDQSAALEGNWESPCIVEDNGGLKKIYLRVENGAFELSEQYYAYNPFQSSNCSIQNAHIYVNRTGSLSFLEAVELIAAESSASDTTLGIQLTIENVEVTPLTEDYTQQLNSFSVCPEIHWLVDAPTVINTPCNPGFLQPDLQAPYTVSEIFQVVGNELFMSQGDSNFASTEQPLTLSAYPRFIRPGTTLSSDYDGTDQGTHSLALPLNGRWIEECDHDLNGGQITEYLFTGTAISQQTFEFNDPSCTDPAYTILTDGTFSLGSTTSSETGAMSELEITYERVFLIVQNSALAEELDSMDFCGWDQPYHQFELNVLFPIEVAKCLDFWVDRTPKMIRTVYDNITVIDDKLYRGINPAYEQELRPATLRLIPATRLPY